MCGAVRNGTVSWQPGTPNGVVKRNARARIVCAQISKGDCVAGAAYLFICVRLVLVDAIDLE